ncbi:NDMA-dependent alcohol dehydrogenase [Gordonia sp. FQ]|uniref:NDMA-dependent alcohol dehydrogenase n=1 Tax=Gordonia sp. FQ TaxID=3446634 RepID=UPI003F8328A9
MKTTAAILWQAPGDWDVREVELDEPGDGEVLVKVMASGLCHSDDHFAKGDMQFHSYPACGGHEGAGIVEAVGPGVTRVEPGDHVVTSFIAACGHCRMCVTGHQNLCDAGHLITKGTRPDGSFRMHIDDVGVAQNACLSTFSEWTTVPVECVVKIDDDIPFETACIVGCAVPTGWGSATRAADIEVGDVVVVVGTGGIGMSAVQGAAFRGAGRVIAVDPVPMKRDLSLKLGATDAVETIDEAGELARSLTNGQGADAVIVCIGVPTQEQFKQAYDVLGKRGTLVVTSAAPHTLTEMSIPVLDLTMSEKRIQGALYGMAGPQSEVPMLLDLYKRGALRLNEMITTQYTLDQVNDAYLDMHAGKNIRGVISFEDRHAASSGEQ